MQLHCYLLEVAGSVLGLRFARAQAPTPFHPFPLAAVPLRRPLHRQVVLSLTRRFRRLTAHQKDCKTMIQKKPLVSKRGQPTSSIRPRRGHSNYNSKPGKKLSYRFVKHRKLCFFVDRPDPLFTVDTVVASLMAILAQRYAQILLMLLYMVSVTGASRATHPAWQRLNFVKVLFFGRCKFVVHEF